MEIIEFKNKSGLRLSGVLYTPKKKTKSCILFAHGFTSNKDRATHIKSADEFAKAGFAAFRFDFGGCGKSEERSPINHVHRINTPVMIAHGLDDSIVLPSQSIAFHNALRNAGKESELFLYKDFAHLKEFSYPTHPVGKRYWEDCVKFLRKTMGGFISV